MAAVTSVIGLTTGRDEILPQDVDQVVQGTSATLTAGTLTYAGSTSAYVGGDRLDGGAGYDVLALSGSGSFNLAALDQFTGFEEVRLNNATGAGASLIRRDGVDLTVTLGDGTAALSNPGSYYSSSTGGISVDLAKSRVTLRGGNESDRISARSADHLNAGSSINGGAGYDYLYLSYSAATGGFDPVTGNYRPPVYVDTVYDLTSISLSQVESLSVYGAYNGYGGTTTVVKVSTQALADVTSIYADSGSRLTTADATLDLTGKSISGSSGGGIITSSNAAGTTFTVGSATVATLIQGGAGQDTVVVKNQTLTAAQREQIFTGSIEIVTDASGSYNRDGSLNRNPTAVGDAATAGSKGIAEKSAAQGVLANDSDPDGDRLSVASVNGVAAKVGQAVAGAFGTLTLEADGAYRYAGTKPVASASVDRFTYTVSDGRGGFAQATLDLTLMPSAPTDDVYLVTGPDDVVTELPGGGIDTVRTSLGRYTLGANVENLVYTGKPTFQGIGNDLDNLILGGRNSDRLEGLGGVDTLVGGLGNDTYTVDDTRDVVIERAGEGTDRVLAQASYTLSDNVENLFLTTGLNLSGTGNALDNTIQGNRGRNVLDGRGGADTLIGGEGDDVFVLRAWETEGDVIQDFAGAGAAGGDRLEFRGFGAGAFLTHETGSDLYTIHAGPALGGMSESFRLAGVTGLDLLSGTGIGDVTFAA